MKKNCVIISGVLILSLGLGGCRFLSIDWSSFDWSCLGRCIHDTFVLAEQTQGPVVAQVDGVSITQAECADRLKNFPGDRAYLSSKMGKQYFLDSLIREKVLVRLAQRKGLDRDPQYLLKVEQFKYELLAQTYRDHLLANMAPNEGDVLKHYFANRKIPQSLDYVVSHIVLRSMVDAKKAQALLGAGKPFSAVAQSMSIDKTTAKKGGALGLLSPADKTFYGKNLENLQDEQVSGIIKTPKGYELLRCDKTLRPNVTVPKEVREKARLQSEYVESDIQNAKSSMKIEINENVFNSLMQQNHIPPASAATTSMGSTQ